PASTMVNASGSPTYPNPITPTVAWSEASRCFKSSASLMSLGPPPFPCSRSAPVCLKNVAARNRHAFALPPSIRAFLRRPCTLIASESAELVDFGAPWGTCIAGREARQLRACGLEQLLDPTAAPGERGRADMPQLGTHGAES